MTRVYPDKVAGVKISVASEAKLVPQLDVPVIVQVAETMKNRTTLTDRIMTTLVATELFLLVVIAILVILAINWGLKPLSLLRKEIDRKLGKIGACGQQENHVDAIHGARQRYRVSEIADFDVDAVAVLPRRLIRIAHEYPGLFASLKKTLNDTTADVSCRSCDQIRSVPCRFAHRDSFPRVTSMTSCAESSVRDSQ